MRDRASRSGADADGTADRDRAADRRPTPAPTATTARRRCSTAAASRSRCIAAPTSRSTPTRSTPTPCRPGPCAATGSARPCSPSSRALDELARRLGIDPLEFRAPQRDRSRRRCSCRSPGAAARTCRSAATGSTSAWTRCAARWPSGGGSAAPAGDWQVGRRDRGLACSTPPRPTATSPTPGSPNARRGLHAVASGTAEFGNGTTTVHRQFAAGELGVAPERDRRSSSQTPTRSSTTPAPSARPGSSVAGTAVLGAAERLEDLQGLRARTRPTGAGSCSTPRGRLRRHPPLGRLQRPGLPGRGLAADRRGADPAQRPRRRRRHGDQPDAVPRPGRGRGRPGARRGDVRARRSRRGGERAHADAAQLPRSR